MTIRTYRDLKAWQRSMELVVEVYRLTESFPKCEPFGLISQIPRATVSIPSKIAEGHGRLSRKDVLQYLSIARGSVMEVETQRFKTRTGWATSNKRRAGRYGTYPKRSAVF